MQSVAITNQINSLPESVVAEIAERAIGDKITGGSVSWMAEHVSIQSIGTGTLGMWNVRGEVSYGSTFRLWNARLKALDPSAQDGLADFNSPSRELDALRSGQLGDAESGIVPVPVFGITDRPDGTAWVWMQDMSDAEQPPWSATSYLTAARHVGIFNGRWLESSYPTGDWIATDGSMDRRLAGPKVYAPSFESVRQMSDQAMVVQAGSRIGVSRMLSLLDDMKALFDAAADLSRSVAHNDMHARNLFPHDDEVTFAIDWASIGLASIGVDAGGLAGASITWGQDEAEIIEEIEPQIFSEYLTGLRMSGWEGDESKIRLGYLSTFACYAAHLVFMLNSFVTEGPLATHQRRRMGVNGDDVYSQIAARLERFTPMVDEGLALIR